MVSASMKSNDERKSVLLIGLKGSSFCINDETILKKKFEVKSIYLSTSYLKELPQLVFSIFKELRCRDVVYIWFGDIWAVIGVFIAKLLGKKSIVVAGGYDVANEPSWNYGLMTRRLMRLAPILSFTNCDRILAVSGFTKRELLNIIPNDDKVTVLGNSIDVNHFVITKQTDRDRITTVGNVDQSKFVIKGFAYFLEVVKMLPHQKFMLVGKISPDVQMPDLKNLELVGPRYGKDLVNDLNSSKFYIQLGHRESFGVAVIEAMACGCIPIVSDSGGLPDTIGDAGVKIPFGSWEEVARAVDRDYDPIQGERARQWVVDHYDNSVRSDVLWALVEELCAMGSQSSIDKKAED